MANVTLITGSTLGSAEYVAEMLAEKLEEAGFSTEVLHGPELSELSAEGTWLVVTSTHGAGDLPDNLQPLFDEIEENKPDLSRVRYGAMGIGNREYDLFCGAIDKMDRLLTACGAKRLGDRLDIDVLEHEIPEDPAEEWVENWKTLLS
ncbi:FMN-binding protein MioC [Erwinia psidii]|uniref:FMN-binding protein MioC n=1 Tax=Erwinia psidii TaxID=69224 RepID=A0A3N6RZZ8_9GAMM|nr:FMN-binding protein MioC [Erwinia psidii]MCX8958461.1 FMN-binding protein MioC [Erwinia psidii]MCX8961029.1 FMN-binding protein MioC [Erwinia psidii]MCX8965543.1 FMN-binding protein MioC [Erwinia psidii]RQM38828.1 FMN-binding protein MioC [Erwinia psidii]